jgi:A/G-specific adenine glycosylase
MKLSATKINSFQEIVLGYYKKHARTTLPWRTNTSDYYVAVSEIMLQQTQVDRVIPFFNNWINQFPDWQALAGSSQVTVLKHWKGLGYNSRALRLQKLAQAVVSKHGGKLPADYETLKKLPGIGPYTAGAIMAFVYNKPVVMIETNIRRVFLYCFFNTPQSRTSLEYLGINSPAPLHRGAQPAINILYKNQTKGISPYVGGVAVGRGGISDKDILELVQQSLPAKDVRKWYWALMDYGSHLGRELKINGKKFNPNTTSRHYTKQAKFIGSDRQIRGRILEILLAEKTHVTSFKKLINELSKLSDDINRVENIIEKLRVEGFIEIQGEKILLKK